MPRIPMTPQEHDDAIRALGRPSKEHESSPNWVADADLDIMATTPHGLWALYRLAYVVQNDGTGEADECAERLRAAHALIDPAELAHRFVAHYHEIRGAAWSEWAPLLDLMGYCGPAWGTVLPLLMSAWNDAAVHEHRDDVRESASSAAARLLPSMPDDEADRLRARLVHPDNPAHHWHMGYPTILALVARDDRSYAQGSRARQELLRVAGESARVMPPVLQSLVSRGGEGAAVRRILLRWWDRTDIQRTYFPQVLELVAHSGLELLNADELQRLSVHEHPSVRALVSRLAAVTVVEPRGTSDGALPPRRTG